MYSIFATISLLTSNITASAIEAIVTDIEGTTTAISFVQDTLFPYAKAHVGEYIMRHHTEPAVSQLLQEVAQIAEIKDDDLLQISQTLFTWMEQDKKITPLKTLQGMMWKAGYEQGNFQGHVYLDAFEKLSDWHKSGLALYVYSSGSVAAQKLLFSHSTYGDMTPLFSGYFDTKIGNKREAKSYRNIAEQLYLSPENILFLSDVVEELDAAAEAGLQTYLIVREESFPPENCPHPVAANFYEIRLFTDSLSARY